MSTQNEIDSIIIDLSQQDKSAPATKQEVLNVAKMLGYVNNLAEIESLTYAEAQNLVADSGLNAGAMYLITDATSANIQVLLRAKSVSTFFTDCQLINDRFDIMEYDIDTDVFTGTDNLACVVRNVGGTWGFINDENHKPRNVSGISQSLTDFTITYTRSDYNKIRSLLCTPDETYVAAGVNAGASVGLTTSIVKLKQDFTVQSYIGYNGSVWEFFGAYGVTSATFNAGILTINHTNVGAGFICSAIVRGGNYRCVISSASVGEASTEISFLDASGNVVTTPDTNMKVLFSRGVVRDLVPSLAGISNSNIWVLGQMSKIIS